jgi:SAM-dependent methyltransferase
MLTETTRSNADGLLTCTQLAGASGRPSPWVARWLAARPPGRVLDLACGSGRHARWAAGLGHQVVAVDRDALALEGLKDARITALQEDLEQGAWSLMAQRFDVIVCTNYLYRPRMALMLALLAPGGLWIHETFALGNERFGRPRNPDFLLREGELLRWAALAGLQVLGFESGVVCEPNQACVQRIAAVRDASPQALP